MRTDETALFIIDMQNDFVLPASPWCIAGAKRTIPRIVYVLKTFREKGRPVFHLVREYRADGSDVEAFRYQEFVDGTPCAISQTTGCDIVKELQPQKHEYRIVKKRFSGFMNTELDLLLRRLRVTHTVITGTQYPNCVRATAFDAVALGYDVTVVTDATSATTDEIAQANITDLTNIGIQCIPSSALAI